jgi:hypothetical protein
MTVLNSAYQAWVEKEAVRIKSDGCTGVTQMFRECCLEHDLAYRHHRDPRTAFLHGWYEANLMTREQADKRFRLCMQKRSWFGAYSPVSWIRWMGVRLLGRFTW